MLPRRTRPVPDRPRVRRGPLNRPPCPRRPHRRRGPMELRPALAGADWHRARDSPAAPGAPAPSSRRAIVRTGDGATGSGAGSVIYGLIAAISWGTSAIAATNAARRAGTYIAVLSGQGIGVAVLVVLAAFLRPSLGAIDPATAIGLVAAGLLGLLGYLTFYRALEYGGAVGLTSPISATFGGITTLLA